MLTLEGLLARIREAGWSVGVHNDYRKDGELMTFWLFTHADGRYVKSEGYVGKELLVLGKIAEQIRLEL